MIKFFKYLILNYPGTIVFIFVVIGGVVYIYTKTDTRSNVYSLMGSGRGGYSSGATWIIAALAFFVFILIGIINTGAEKPKRRFTEFKKKGKKRR